MSGKFIVGDEFRTNPLSLKPGGSTVTVHFEKGPARVYDKIKKPKSYISALSKLHNSDDIIQIDVDGNVIWIRTETERNFY